MVASKRGRPAPARTGNGPSNDRVGLIEGKNIQSQGIRQVRGPRGLPIFQVYDGRRLLGDVFETPGGFVGVPAEGGPLGPFSDRRAASAAIRAARAP